MRKRNPIKKILKRGLQQTAARIGRHARKSREPQLLILMYHRVLPANDERARLEEPGMLITPETFATHLNLLSQYFEFITLADWLDRRARGLHLPDKACAITFDDGWSDNYEFAFPVLQSLQVPATIFLVAEMIGTHKMFWPERLAQLIDRIASDVPQHWADPALSWITQSPTDYSFDATPPNREQITQIIAFAKRNTDRENQNYITQAEQSLALKSAKSAPELLDWEQVRIMLKSKLIDVGSHTCQHVRLNDTINGSLLEHEIISSRALIEDHTGQKVKTFCFPNGDYSKQALSLIRQYYTGAVTTASGWNNIHSDNYLLQRIGVHEDIAADRAGFLARVAGWV